MSAEHCSQKINKGWESEMVFLNNPMHRVKQIFYSVHNLDYDKSNIMELEHKQRLELKYVCLGKDAFLNGKSKKIPSGNTALP